MNIQNVQVSDNRFLFQKHHEIHDRVTYNPHVEIITSTDIEDKLNNHKALMYFYKPNCASCTAMAESYNKLADVIKEISTQSEKIISKQLTINPYDNHILNRYRIQNPDKFVDLKIYKYCYSHYREIQYPK